VHNSAVWWLGDTQEGKHPETVKYGDKPFLADCQAGYYMAGMQQKGTEQLITCQSDGEYSEIVHCEPAALSISGVVDDAQNSGIKLKGASMTLRKGGVVISEGKTTSSGIFRGTAVEGECEIEVKKDGYITATKKINVSAPVSVGQGADISMSKILPPGAWRITLSWGKYPTDLDSHIFLGKNREKHVYYARTAATATGTGGLTVELDRDDTSSYGPETTTFFNVGKCTKKGYCLIYFEVENYTPNDGSIGESEGLITAYRGDKVEGTVKIPKSAGNAVKFIVFTLDATEGKEKIYQGDKSTPPFLSTNHVGTADWYGSMGSPATWSKAVEGSVLFSMRRGQKNDLSDLQEAQYYNVQDSYGPLDCQEVDWSATLQGWSDCPAGFYLSGLYRHGVPDEVSQITKGYCCKAKSMPAEWGHCYEQGIFAQPGAVGECSQRNGEPTAMVGLHRTAVNDITGIDKAKCCNFKDVGLVDSPPPSVTPPVPRDFHRRRRRAASSTATTRRRRTRRRRRT